jgi:Protein of unknown function (DUF3078)
MSRKQIVLSLLLFFTITLSAQKVIEAKDAIKELDKKDAADGWTKIGGVGLDFALLNLINPRIGAGDNRVGFGGLLNYSANLKQGKVLWDNKFGLQLGVVKVASDPAGKSADVLQATSQWGYQMTENGKWYGAGLFDFQTQFLPTYGKNYLKEDAIKGQKQALTAKIFAPAIFKFAPGVIYKHSPNLKVMYSPIAVKAVIVANDAIAKTGNFIPQEVGATTPKKVDFQMGSEIRADYGNKFLDGKLVYTTTLDLYSNYLREPQNIDVEWYHSLDFIIYKNIAVNFKTDWFYDHDILVLKGGDANNKGRSVFFRNALLLKYNKVF